MPNVPPLRFPEFSGEWEKCQLGDITVNFSRRNKEGIDYPMFSVTNDRGFVPQSEQFEDREMIGTDIKAYKIIHNGEFAYNPARINVGSIAKYNGVEDCMISSLYVCFDVDRKRINSEWFFHLLKTSKMNFYYNLNGEGGVRIYLFYPNFARIKSSYPTKAEQQKIADLFNLLTKRIETQIRVIDKLESLIKGIYNSILWREYKQASLSDIFIERNERTTSNNQYEVLSSTAKGLFRQADYFDKEVASANNVGYKVLRLGDVVLSPQNLWLGNINYNDIFEIGIVSPSYKVFSIRKQFNPYYVSCFLKTHRALYEYANASEQGASVVRRNLDLDAFMAITFPMPDKDIQDSVSKKLQAINKKLSVEKQILDKLKEQKNYLLSQMFI